MFKGQGRKWVPLFLAGAFISAALAVPSCGDDEEDGGACVDDQPTFNTIWCSNNWARDGCENDETNFFHEGKDCDEVGFDVPCGDGQTWVMGCSYCPTGDCD
jgi:hypothetical protein